MGFVFFCIEHFAFDGLIEIASRQDEAGVDMAFCWDAPGENI